MTEHALLLSTLNRIARASSVLRVRANDTGRLERNGGSTAQLRERVAVLIGKLEKIADELEDALA